MSKTSLGEDPRRLQVPSAVPTVCSRHKVTGVHSFFVQNVAAVLSLDVRIPQQNDLLAVVLERALKFCRSSVVLSVLSVLLGVCVSGLLGQFHPESAES